MGKCKIRYHHWLEYIKHSARLILATYRSSDVNYED